VELFKQAAALDPTNPNARLYLATSYMSQWIPGAESPENLAFASMAKEEFLKVIEKDRQIPRRSRRSLPSRIIRPDRWRRIRKLKSWTRRRGGTRS